MEHDKPEHHYLDLELSTTTGDHNYIKANEKFWAVAIRGGGGPVLVRRHDQHGKITSDAGTLNGHKGACSFVCAVHVVGNRLSHHAKGCNLAAVHKIGLCQPNLLFLASQRGKNS